MPVRPEEVRDLPPLPKRDDTAKAPQPQPAQREDTPLLPPSAMGDWAAL